ncbi:type II toxin-antitoxin system ParD family antitoxin [Capnocytophaga stomatis]|uniref:type II toxin-antitoxin system ParD family antitoxin n=1 Tax=Capnocytophaga stomatis TaxID=1848904 RepID=UPI00385E8EE2
MAKNISIVLEDYFSAYVNAQVESGKFASASEVVRAALQLFEYEEAKKNALVAELKKGETSGFVADFNRETFLKELHNKHITK